MNGEFGTNHFALVFESPLGFIVLLFFASTSCKSGDERSSLNASNTCWREDGTLALAFDAARCGCGECIGVCLVGNDDDDDDGSDDGPGGAVWICADRIGRGYG